jgi:hypothetical protein
MSNILQSSERIHRNTRLQPGLDALNAWLENHHYSQHAREQIVIHTGSKGMPVGSAYLEPEDLRGATTVFVKALAAAAKGGFDRAIQRVEESDPIPSHLVENFRLVDDWVAPIRGGSPDDEPYRPSAEDLEEYCAWSAQLEATRAFYDRNSIAEFNASI